MNSRELLDHLAEKPMYQNYLYRYGYLITNTTENLSDKLAPMKTWFSCALGSVQFLIHPDQRLYHYQSDDKCFFLIGHCYNPFRMIANENTVLTALVQALSSSEQEYCEYLSELTGVFVTGYITGDDIVLYGDAAGMLMAYYGTSDTRFFISSHADLLGYITDSPRNEYVDRLIHYRFYRLFGYTLPGDLSPYNGFRRLVPNHCLRVISGICSVNRFYPTKSWDTLTNMFSIKERAHKAAEILKNSMLLIPQKWSKPAISLTGGCDSKTTLSCAVGNYDKYQYFSYVSQDAEKIDADGAHIICENLGLFHEILDIPEEFDDYADIELVRDIISANQGDIGKLGTRELQKRIYLTSKADFDVEVKSWVSEIGRAYYHKRFAKITFPAEPTPRYLTTLYKVFFHNRRLVRETDRVFADYIEKYLILDQLHGWNWIDLLFWEFRVSSWNGLVITGEHRYSFDITIPYNNRKLLELLLAVPAEVRINDTLYQNIRTLANPAVDKAGVAITNLKHTANRAKAERFYLDVHSKLPI